MLGLGKFREREEKRSSCHLLGFNGRGHASRSSQLARSRLLMLPDSRHKCLTVPARARGALGVFGHEGPVISFTFGSTSAENLSLKLDTSPKG
jgi:hypothetical protein